MSKFKRAQQQAQQQAQQKQTVTSQAETTVTAPPAEKAINQPIPKEGIPITQMEGIDEELLAMRDFIAENIVGIRPWANREGGMNATIRFKVLADDELPEGFESVADVAMDLLESLTEVKENTGIPTFADFNLTYDRNKKAQARLIKANEDDNTGIVVLSIEYSVSGVKGSFVQAKSNQNNVEVEKPAEPVKKAFGFGRKS